MRWLVALVVLAGCDRVIGLQTIDFDAGAPPPPPGDWTMVSAGDSSTCAIKTDGSLWCWGDNSFGQLGIGAGTLGVTAPKQVGDAMWSSVSIRHQTTCGIESNGTLWCWGLNTYGQVGNGDDAATKANVLAPVMVDSRSWNAVAVGFAHTCAIASDATLWCWGDNSNGALGTGDGVLHTTPAAVMPGTTWSALTTGAYHSCAIAADNTAWCWGQNYSGQAATGTYLVQPTPARVNADSWTSLAAGGMHTCGVRSDHHLRCWGSNYDGQLASTTASSAPGPLAPDVDSDDWTSVTAGDSHTCATNSQQQLYCWGTNSDGQLGNSSSARVNASPVIVNGAARQWAQISGGFHETCGVGADNNLWCFGLTGLGSSASSHEPAQVPGTWTAVAAGQSSTCAIDSMTRIQCWGDNSDAQIGDDTFTERTAPTVISDVGFAAITAGPYAMYAIDTNGELFAWGNAYYGLGDGAQERLQPTLMPGGPWSAVSAGSSHTCALSQTGGQLFCWGDNSFGELGTGDMTSYTTPHQAGTMTWTSASAGSEFMCGVSAGTVYCWGYNYYGEVGNNTMTTMPSPTMVELGAQVSASSSSACAIDNAGAATCWGYNYYGVIGNGTTNTAYAPTAVIGGAASWKSISSGTSHVCAIGRDGSLWCWGDDSTGEIGDNGSMPALAPTRVGEDTDWTAVSSGGSHTCGMRSGGTLWCWGDNSVGQLGTGVTGAGKPQLVPP